MDVDLRDLEAFVAVARTRNFRRAATEQNVAVASLSQRLRALEERLGIRLMNRTTRSVALTAAGELLLQRIGPALGAVNDALVEVGSMRNVPSGLLRINAPLPAIDLVLAPMIAPFLAAYPQIHLDLVADSSLIDIVAQGFDAGIRYGEHLAQDMIAIPFGGEQRYAVAGSPAFFAAHGRPRYPRDLLRMPCLRTRFSSGLQIDWEFEKNGRVVKLSPSGQFTAMQPPLHVRAAIEGVGLIMTFEGYVKDAIARGELETVLDDWCPPFPGPFLYYPSRRQPPPALAAFVAFVGSWRKQERAQEKT